MHRFSVLLIALALSIPVNAHAEGTSASTSLSPELQAALSDFDSRDFATRDQAFAKLQAAFGNQIMALLSTKIPEVRSRVRAALEYNDALCRWGIAISRLPDDQRKSILAFAAEPNGLLSMANLFHPDLQTRLSAIRSLGKIKHPAVDDLLAYLTHTADRPECITAMDVVCDREPAKPVVDALWARAVAWGYFAAEPFSNAQMDVVFRGTPVNVAYRAQIVPFPGADNALACQALAALNPPDLDPLLVSFFAHLEQMSQDKSATPRGNMFSDSYDALRNAYELAVLRKPNDLLPILFRFATGPGISPRQIRIGQMVTFSSSRTPAIAALCRILSHDPAALNLKQHPTPKLVWVFPAEADELAAIDRLRHWAASHPEWTANDPSTQPDSLSAPSTQWREQTNPHDHQR